MGSKNQDWHNEKRESIKRKREALEKLGEAMKRCDYEAAREYLDEYSNEIRKDRIK